MARPNRFQIMQHVKGRIVETLRTRGERILTIATLGEILDHNRVAWTLPQKTLPNELAGFLVELGILEERVIELPTKKSTKYLYGDVTDFEIALSIKKGSYLSHYSAMHLHDLTNNIPKTIYTNTEQKKKNIANTAGLEQKNVDLAFSRPMRQTNQIARMGNIDVVLLNGKNVDRIGVKEFDFNGRFVFATDLERTLVDITVRPNYAGGVGEVLEAYKAALGRISVNRLAATLRKMDYIYPYHQAIGFYLEQAGYDSNAVSLFQSFERRVDFYLTYQMKEKGYSERWKLYFPAGF